MDEKDTSDLMHILQHTSPENIGAYEKAYLSHSLTDFSAYMDALIARKGMKRQTLFQKADLPQKYGYKLLSGEKRTRDRDNLLRLCIAMELTLKEVQRVLTLYKMPVLYPRLSRDAIFIIAINKGVGSVDLVNEWLREAGQPALSRSPE